jgi:hypothetical protein
LTSGLLIAVFASAAPLYAQAGFDAGDEAYRAGEARRLQQINRQLSAIDQMRWWRGWSSSAPLSAGRYPPSLDYIYATGRRGLFGRYRERVVYGAYDIFEPWPIVPGDIWGSDDAGSVRQPIGQRQIQTGPNRWESYPIYREPLPPLPTAPPPSTAREF